MPYSATQLAIPFPRRVLPAGGATRTMPPMPTAIELCAGAGGQALGLEQAGFDHAALVENEPIACATLRLNRPHWPVIEQDLHVFDGTPYRGTVDVIAAGLPCPPFSAAGKQLGERDERNLFPAALRIIQEVQPRAVMIENVRGLLGKAFNDYRQWILDELGDMGYQGEWRLLNASDYGVPQLRPRAILVALQSRVPGTFTWPGPLPDPPLTVGETLRALMAEGGWRGANAWAKGANAIAPTLVGGSKKHGGPDLGPTRARREWAALGVDGIALADAPPPRGFSGIPRLTVAMTARLQGFPPDWQFAGGKTAAYRQVGNAFPPPVAEAVGKQLLAVLESKPHRPASLSRKAKPAAAAPLAG